MHREKGVPLLYTSDTYADDVPYYTESPLALDGEEDKGLLNIPCVLNPFAPLSCCQLPLSLD